MARQKELLATGQIIPTALHAEMQRSYLEYAMSVIVGRALPDVRDGLKPVHRRILYAMHELGLTSDRPFRKCARVVGDVLGKYHPHGDQSVYDALVRMVQDFSSRYPLLAGHGNFGSVDNDPPAAMRYTETRLAAIADEALLGDISEAIVDFTSNFDNSQQEPVVLPAQLPLLLLNGCAGIAVGMATNVPPHNLGELVDGAIALIDNPELGDEKLGKIIPGPDFPTGGEIIETQGIREAYLTGKGIIPVRGITSIERLDVGRQRRKERTAIIVTELPYQVAKALWIEKVAELVNQGRLEGIADLRDESDRTGMRVVIELKRDADPELVLAALYRQTALQNNFGAILLGLVDNKPCQLTLRQLLQEFLTFREQTLTRQYANELEQAQNRLHLVEGLLMALNHLDEAIDILRHAPDGTTAKYRLQEQLGISEVQSDAILAMPMRRLTGLERQKLQSESDELQARIVQLQTLLRDRSELLKALKKELRSLKRKFGDARRTKILVSSTKKVRDKKDKKETGTKDNPLPQRERRELETKGQRDKAAKETKETRKQKTTSCDPLTASQPLTLFTPQPPPEDAVLDITYQGKASWRSAPSTSSQAKLDKTSDDFLIYSEAIQKRESLVILTDTGKAYPLSTQEIPPVESQPLSLLSLLPKSSQENANRAVFYGFLPKDTHTTNLLLLTEQGRIKRMPLSELNGLTNRGLAAIKLKEGDRLRYAGCAMEGQEAAIATSGGRILRLPLIDDRIPTMGRNTQGNTALPLRYGEQLVGCVTLNSDELMVLVSQLGYGKRVALTSLRLAKLGDIGTQAMQFINKNDNLAGMVTAKKGGEIVLVTNRDRHLFISVDSIALWGKDGTGNNLVKLKGEEIILEVISHRGEFRII